MGLPPLMDVADCQLATELACVVVSLAYRLAPEHVFPAVIDNCYAALTWLFSKAMLVRTQEQSIKDGLVANTEAAAAGGAFGIPSFLVGDELFSARTDWDRSRHCSVGQHPLGIVRTSPRAKRPTKRQLLSPTTLR